jgi:nicotinate-nucleotide adenylyltransferase
MDPPHLGHREAVRGLFQHPGVRNVLVIPTASPPHKPVQATIEHRTQMTRINFSSTSRDPFPREVQVDEIEIKRAQRNPNQPSYSFDTLQELKRLHPHLAFVLGSDQLQRMHTWHRFPEILTLCHWIVLERKPNGSEHTQKTLQEWNASGLVENSQTHLWKIRNSSFSIQAVTTDAPPISSTQIRNEIAKTGAPPPSLLLPEVEGYLKLHSIYGISGKHDSRTNRK